VRILIITAVLGISLACLSPAWASGRNTISYQTAGRETSHAAQSGNRTPSTVPHADDALLLEVWEKLLAVVRTHPANIKWPPSISLVSEGDLNAYAMLLADEGPNGTWKPRVDQNGQFIPVVVVDQLIMEEVIQGSPDRLAILLAHELSHIVLGHVLPTNIAKRASTGTLKILFTSEQEHDADINGMKLAVTAGYSYKGAREIWEVFNSEAFTQKHPRMEYSSFEAEGEDHPSWTDRLSYIDKDRANIWKAMSAYENGVTFLQIQQYAAAEESFSRVVQEFSDSYEAWANLGYARLMIYLDTLNASDLERYDIGQLVVGSFYLRPEELRSKTRGVDEKLWRQAVDALMKALDLKSDLSLTRANLGVAYLLNPDGKDAKAASELLEQSIASMMSDKNLYYYNAAAVLINAGVAALANGQPDLSARRLGEATRFLQGDPVLSGAVDYNLALLALSSDSRERVNTVAQGNLRMSPSALLLRFLKTTTPASAWWDLGYKKYAQLRADKGFQPESKPALTRGTRVRLRRIPSIEVSPGVLVTLSDRSEVVKAKVRPLTVLPVTGTNIELLHHPPSGSDMLVGRRVVAIYLHGPTAPKLKIQPMGTGTRSSTLSIGMTKNDVEQMIGGDYVLTALNDPDVRYYFYPELGVGVHYDGVQRVDELLLAQITVTQH
jgi:tetratricopeptide (TPR) repeat protein